MDGKQSSSLQAPRVAAVARAQTKAATEGHALRRISDHGCLPESRAASAPADPGQGPRWVCSTRLQISNAVASQGACPLEMSETSLQEISVRAQGRGERRIKKNEGEVQKRK